MMKITWFGHAAFAIQTGRTRILTDPYSSAIGFAPIGEAFGIVTLSHQNPKYHSCLDEISGAPQVIDGLELARSGEAQVLGGVTFGAVEVAEDEAGNGPNAMVWAQAQGVRILHMGDCGCGPTPAQVAACGRVDVLLALAGAGPTLSIVALLDFIEALEPKLVLPMHFGAPGLKTMTLAPIEELERAFTARLGTNSAQRATDASVEIDAHKLPQSATLLILPAAR